MDMLTKETEQEIARVNRAVRRIRRVRGAIERVFQRKLDPKYHPLLERALTVNCSLLRLASIKLGLLLDIQYERENGGTGYSTPFPQSRQRVCKRLK